MIRHVPLRLEGLSKSFGSHSALKGVSLDLNPGEITAIVGASGAGKTTLLRLIAGMEAPEAGQISIGDTVLSTPEKIVPPEARKIGLIFQDFALFPHLSVERNIGFGLRQKDKLEAGNIVDLWLQRLSLTHRREAFPHQLSGGEQQRVAIARALAAEPAAILMDEPFSGLDPALRASVRDQALSAVREANIPALLVTHDPAEALADADSIAVLSDGEIVQFGAPDTLYTSPCNHIAACALGPVVRLKHDDTPQCWRREGRLVMRFRPESVRAVESGGAALKVISARKIGGLTHVQLQSGSTVFTAQMILPALPPKGSLLRVDVAEDAVFDYE